MKYLLDTDTFSEMVKGVNPKIVKRMATLEMHEAVLSVVTCGEIMFGLQMKPLKSIMQQRMDRLLQVIPIWPLTPEVARHYGELRAHLRASGTPIGPNDLWIAAHALSAKLTLVTNNTREFERVPKLKLQNWIGNV